MLTKRPSRLPSPMAQPKMILERQLSGCVEEPRVWINGGVQPSSPSLQEGNPG